MQPVEAYRILLPASLVILALGLAFIVRKWPGNQSLTFSQLVARRRSSIFYYILLFAVVLPPLNLFVVRWFAPTFRLTPWFSIFVLAASVLQFGATLIPEVGGWKTRCHRALAAGSAACLVPPLVIIALAGAMSGVGRLAAIAALVVVAGCSYAVLSHGGKHPYFRLLQVAYYGAFFLTMLVVMYLR